jgi:hypothetical protein
MLVRELFERLAAASPEMPVRVEVDGRLVELTDAAVEIDEDGARTAVRFTVTTKE